MSFDVTTLALAKSYTKMIIGSGDLVVGETYKVIFDSTEYSCECVTSRGVPTVGSGDLSFVDYPFVFYQTMVS